MSYNYTLRYRTFDQLLSDVQVDFQNLSLENMIEPQQLIKVAKRVTYDLGLRVMMTKEALLEIEKGRVRLPDDFFVLNFALICYEHEEHTVLPQGTHIEERKLFPTYQETPSIINSCTDGPVNCTKCQTQVCGCGSCNTCNSTSCGCNQQSIPTACSSVPPFNPLVPFGDSCVKPRVFMNCKGEGYELVQIVNSTQTNFYRQLLPIKILENAESIDCGCANLYMNCSAVGWIKDGWLYTNFTDGKVYINYQGALEDNEGNLLVVDHDMINEYYEFAVKERILQNLMMNDEPVGQKLAFVKQELKIARNYALSIVNTPNFSEIKRIYNANKKAQYNRYYSMFQSYPSYQCNRNPNHL